MKENKIMYLNDMAVHRETKEDERYTPYRSLREKFGWYASLYMGDWRRGTVLGDANNEIKVVDFFLGEYAVFTDSSSGCFDELHELHIRDLQFLKVSNMKVNGDVIREGDVLQIIEKVEIDGEVIDEVLDEGFVCYDSKRNEFFIYQGAVEMTLKDVCNESNVKIAGIVFDFDGGRLVRDFVRASMRNEGISMCSECHKYYGCGKEHEDGLFNVKECDVCGTWAGAIRCNAAMMIEEESKFSCLDDGLIV